MDYRHYGGDAGFSWPTSRLLAWAHRNTLPTVCHCPPSTGHRCLLLCASACCTPEGATPTLHSRGSPVYASTRNMANHHTSPLIASSWGPTPFALCKKSRTPTPPTPLQDPPACCAPHACCLSRKIHAMPPLHQHAHPHPTGHRVRRRALPACCISGGAHAIPPPSHPHLHRPHVLYLQTHSFGASAGGAYASPPVHRQTHTAATLSIGAPIWCIYIGAMSPSSPPARPGQSHFYMHGLCRRAPPAWSRSRRSHAATSPFHQHIHTSTNNQQQMTFCRCSPRLVAPPEGQIAHPLHRHITQPIPLPAEISTPSFSVFSFSSVYLIFLNSSICTDCGATTATRPVSLSPPPHREYPFRSPPAITPPLGPARWRSPYPYQLRCLFPPVPSSPPSFSRFLATFASASSFFALSLSTLLNVSMWGRNYRTLSRPLVSNPHPQVALWRKMDISFAHGPLFGPLPSASYLSPPD